MPENRITIITQHGGVGTDLRCDLRCWVDFDGRQYFASIGAYKPGAQRSTQVHLWHASPRQRKVSDCTARGKQVRAYLEREVESYMETICRM